MIPTSSASSPRDTYTTAAAVPPAVNNCVDGNSGNPIQGHQVALNCAMAAVLGLSSASCTGGAFRGRRRVQRGPDSPASMGLSKFKGSPAGNSGAQKDREYFEPVVLNDGA
ncbi:hypothetical protein H4582DRAFT_2063243 [Lactarius indigo]|nr:hypothetical protein H4582DRAFT_2063243 [Lactarius indigo]